ncbi:MAG: radical SAM protein, partial [Anaerolineae bacterium]|nr:radical SAM protein [Anaerolineae bacterium]
MQPYSLYFHIPFCKRRCAYCDFNTYAGMEKRIPAYSLALQREMALVAGSLPDRLPVHTVFFGGGTPSLMPIDALSAILKTARDRFDFLPDYEMTLEANPGTLAPGYLERLRKLGFNRLSFGMQSADPQELKLLTRLHDFYEVIESVRAARAAGFDNLNLDLIFGLPGQSLERWRSNLNRALDLH